MNFEINPNAVHPIYRQIVDQVRRLVASGQLQTGQDLPSVRTVAMAHAINPMTVSKAYSLLEVEGLLERRRGVGMVVAQTKQLNTQQNNLDLLLPALKSAAQVSRQLGISRADAIAAFEKCLSNPPKESYESE